MAEQQLHRPSPTVHNQPARIGHGSGPAAEAGVDTSGTVEVIFGAAINAFEIVGRTVAEAHAELEEPLTIAPNVTILVNGVEADGDVRLNTNDTLEFVRKAGEKGAER